jgi:ankyrin repeat protein
LQVGANPNARWLKGDEYPIQAALSQPYFPDETRILALLLAYGADPNARGCPYESPGPTVLPNGKTVPGCTAPKGITALTLATTRDDVPAIELLLRAGANPAAEDATGGIAVDHARSEAALALLLRATFPREISPERAALRRREENRLETPWENGPWDETPLTQQIARPYPAPRIPPQPGDESEPLRSEWNTETANGGAQVPLRLGADPNRRLTKDADWTPLTLALAMSRFYPLLPASLLDYGADPNARWCTSTDTNQYGFIQPSALREPSCTLPSGTTPLIYAAMRCDVRQVKALLAHGADTTLRDWTGRTARDYAVLRRDKVILQALHAR